MAGHLPLTDRHSLPGEDPSRNRRAARAARSRRRRRRRRSVVVLLLGLLLVGGAVAVIWQFAGKPLIAGIAHLREPNDWAGDRGTGSVQVQIDPGASGSQIGQVLARAGVVKTADGFVSAYDSDSRAGGIQPGFYTLRRHMSAANAVALLVDPGSRLVSRVTIPEGTRAADVLQKVAKQTNLKVADLVAASKDPAALGLPAAAAGRLEGYLWPATYDVQPTTTAAQLLRQMVAEGVDARARLGISPANEKDVVILASMIQSEGGAVTNFGKVSQVFHNRLRIKMLLQSDATVSYGVQRFGITTTDADRRNPNGWNTYVHPGLPVGPISNPGEAAVRAALHPEPGPWMYFVTTDPDSGLTEFGITSQDHDRLVAKFQAWLRAHPGRR